MPPLPGKHRAESSPRQSAADASYNLRLLQISVMPITALKRERIPLRAATKPGVAVSGLSVGRSDRGSKLANRFFDPSLRESSSPASSRAKKAGKTKAL